LIENSINIDSDYYYEGRDMKNVWYWEKYKLEKVMLYYDDDILKCEEIPWRVEENM